MGLPKIRYQQITLIVNASGDKVPIDAETDKLYNTVTGINVLLTDDNPIFSTFHLDINSQEVFPEKFEVYRVLFRQHVAFGYDYHHLNEPAGGSKLKGTYTDIDGGGSYPYKVVITLRLENRESTDAGKVS